MKWLIWLPVILLIGCEKKKVSPSDKLPIDKYAVINGKFTGTAIRFHRSIYNWPPPPPPDTFHGVQTFVFYHDSVIKSITIGTTGDTIINVSAKIMKKRDTLGYLWLSTDLGITLCNPAYFFYYPAKDSLHVYKSSICKGNGEHNFSGVR